VAADRPIGSGVTDGQIRNGGAQPGASSEPLEAGGSSLAEHGVAEAHSLLLTRRGFIVGAGAAGVSAYVFVHRAPAVLASLAHPADSLEPSFTTYVRRREDFLNLKFEFFNLKIVGTKGERELEIKNPAEQAVITVKFPPQNIAEHAYGTEVVPPAAGLVPDLAARPSRLAFVVPSGTKIRYELETLLTWAKLTPNVVSAAQATLDYDSSLIEPGPNQTALEIPWRLILSPSEKENWKHALEPVTHGGRTELWHTRLVEGVTLNEAAPRSVRAVWARDPAFKALAEANAKENECKEEPDQAEAEQQGVPDPFRSALNQRDRYAIVRLSSNTLNAREIQVIEGEGEEFKDEEEGEGEPIAVNRLMLSSLGAFVDLRGTWEPRESFGVLAEWQQRGTLGRDDYTKLTHLGYLFPFGFPATLVKIIERAPATEPGGTGKSPRPAYLREREFIVVRSCQLSFGGAGNSGPATQPYDGRGFPFLQLSTNAVTTPSLVEVDKSRFPEPSKREEECFQPEINVAGSNVPLLFKMTGTDWAEQEIHFATPVVFVGRTLANDNPKMEALIKEYNALAKSARERSASLGGAKVAIASPAKKTPTSSGTDISISEITWGAEKPTGASRPFFFPAMAEAQVRLSGAEQLTGEPIDPTIEYFEHFLENGFEGAEIFAKLQEQLSAKTKLPALLFNAAQAGGLGAPNLNIAGISKQLGLVGVAEAALEEAVNAGKTFADALEDELKSYVEAGTVEVKKILGEFVGELQGEAAKLLGAIPLKEIIDNLIPVEHLEELGFKVKQEITSTKIKATLEWTLPEDKLKEWPEGGATEGIYEPGDEAELSLEANVETETLHPDKSSYNTEGVLKDFTLNILGKGDFALIALEFKELKFTAANKQKPKVTVKIEKVSLKGPLEFLETLEESMGLGDQLPGLNVTAAMIKAEYDFPLPSIGVGIFALSNVSFGAGVTIPFDGSKPVRARFNFSERSDPFQLSVAGFAGGGFLALAVGGDGVELFEAALEFGASVSFSIGVASGGVSIMAGVYYKYEPKPGEGAILSGFVRVNGELNVLDIVSVAIELYIALTYYATKKELVGQAELKLEVHVFMFHKTIEATVERRFQNTDPTFEALMSETEYEEYRQAFVAVGA
jgi:hypothetical protein